MTQQHSHIEGLYRKYKISKIIDLENDEDHFPMFEYINTSLNVLKEYTSINNDIFYLNYKRTCIFMYTEDGSIYVHPKFWKEIENKYCEKIENKYLNYSDVQYILKLFIFDNFKIDINQNYIHYANDCVYVEHRYSLTEKLK